MTDRTMFVYISTLFYISKNGAVYDPSLLEKKSSIFIPRKSRENP